MKFIFIATARPGHHINEYIEIWVEESKVIQKEPGALGTRLHRIIGHDDKVLAIASWESKQMRDEAMARLEQREDIIAFRNKRSNIVDFQLIAETEEPDWVVLPPDQV